MVGNAHLDPAWMWRIPEGMEAFLATCRSALDRLAETEEFIFTCSSAAHYDFVRQTDAELFRKIQHAVAKGTWNIVGGWWIEADCNLPCAESFVRQGLYGQRFFQENFGKTTITGYCIDSFGHNANLPQFLHSAGMNSYVFMRPQEHELHLEDDLFCWVSSAGKRGQFEVLAYRIPFHYSSHNLSAGNKIEKLKQVSNFTTHPWMLFYGVGNHGGGPTKKEIAEILEAKSGDDNDSLIRFSDPDKFFAGIRSEGVASIPRFTGELQPHAIGCYSAHSEIKRLNRLAEHSLQVAERMSVMAEKITRHAIDHAALTLAWQNVCFNQFHDLIGGVAIPEALDDAISMYREALSVARRVARKAIQSIASNIDTSSVVESLVVFNPTAFVRSEMVEFELWHPDASEKGQPLKSLVLVDSEKRSFDAQLVEPSGKIGGDRVRLLAPVMVTGLGYSSYTILRNEVSKKVEHRLIVSCDVLQNEKVRVGFLDALSERVAFNRDTPVVVNDPTDTWGHGVTGFTDHIGEFEMQNTSVLERGPIRACVRVESRFGNSSLIEDWFLQDASDMLELRVRLNWQETRKLLKFRFRHGVKQPVANYEIPGCVVARPLGHEEHPGQRWLFVSDTSGSQGIGIITDSKYSYSVDEEFMYVTVARSPIYAHHSPPHEQFPKGALRHLDQGEQEFRIWIVQGQDTWQSAKMPQRSQNVLEPLIAHVESSHSGELGLKSGACIISNTNVQLQALKRSEEHAAATVARFIECGGVESSADISLSFLDANWTANFNPFEIKTFRIYDSKVQEVNFLEQSIYTCQA
jgi:alpha-mannosidase